LSPVRPIIKKELPWIQDQDTLKHVMALACKGTDDKNDQYLEIFAGVFILGPCQRLGLAINELAIWSTCNAELKEPNNNQGILKMTLLWPAARCPTDLELKGNFSRAAKLVRSGGYNEPVQQLFDEFFQGRPDYLHILRLTRGPVVSLQPDGVTAPGNIASKIKPTKADIAKAKAMAKAQAKAAHVALMAKAKAAAKAQAQPGVQGVPAGGVPGLAAVPVGPPPVPAGHAAAQLPGQDGKAAGQDGKAVAKAK
jgi:hypothetical protein